MILSDNGDEPVQLANGCETLAETFFAYAKYDVLDHAFEYLDRSGRRSHYSQNQVVENVFRYANALISLGIAHDDIILISINRGDHFFFLFWACQLIGAVAVPAKFPTKSDDDGLLSISRLIETIEPKAIFLEGKIEALNGRAAIVATPDRLAEFRDVEFDQARSIPVRPESLALLQFTSGSTHHPKGCMLTNKAVLSNARSILSRGGGLPNDTNVHWVPLHHDMGLMGGVILPIVGKIRNVIFDTNRFIFRPLSWIEEIADRGRVHTAVSNFALSMVLLRADRLKLEKGALNNVVNLFCGAEPISPSLAAEFLKKMSRFGLRAEVFHAAYGMAELTLLCSSQKGGLKSRKIYPEAFEENTIDKMNTNRTVACVGKPLIGTSVKIVDENGSKLKAGREGEIAIHSPSVMCGYYNNPEATKQRFAGEWLMSGDLGIIIDEELYVTGRVSDLIIVAGQNLFPQDIEQAIAAAVDIPTYRICVFSAPGNYMSEDIVAVVEVRKSFSEGELVEKISKTCMATFGFAAKAVVFCPISTIERTTSGKPKRSKLKKMYLGGTLNRI